MIYKTNSFISLSFTYFKVFTDKQSVMSNHFVNLYTLNKNLFAKHTKCCQLHQNFLFSVITITKFYSSGRLTAILESS